METAENWACDAILLEDANSGTALLQSLRQQGDLNVIGIKPQLDKLTRAAQQSAVLEAGWVYLPAGAPWALSKELGSGGFLAVA